MFDYVRARNRSAAVCLLSLAVFIPALVLPRTGDDHTVRKLILFFSMGATLMSAVWCAVRWNEANRLLRVRTGKGILARWTIDAARWTWFRDHSRTWDTRDGVQPNAVNFTQDPGATGIDVAVSRDGMLVGADFHPLETDVRITVRADWIEFYQVIPKPRGPAIREAIRLPLQPGKESLAADVQAAFARVSEARKSDRRPLLYVVLLCFVGLPAATGLALLIARATGWVE